MTDRPAVAALRARLRDLYSGLHSWRKVQKHYPGVNHETLRRIALTDYLPKERKILVALGLVERREWLPGEWETARRIGKMARETREKVLIR
jgi:hypothetical protein